jgi:hypothetical protein
MRSRTSRGVPEWSGGKDLYMGSPVSGIGTSFGVIGIVPGPPEGPRGSTGWGHLSRRAPWAESGGEPAPNGLGRHFGPPPHAPRVGNPRGGASPLPWGARHPFPPLGRRPPNPRWVLAGPPSQGGLYKGGEGGSNLQPWAPPSSPATPLRLAEARRSPAETRYIHHHAVVLLDLHQPLLPPCWIKKEETSLHRTCVERGGAVRSALGHR